MATLSRNYRILLITLVACQLLIGGNVFGQTAPFYKDKTIRIIVGFTPGGLYDQYARLLARHMGKYIPGNPTIIVQNMPGAGSLSSTNYIYGVAKPDGLTLGMTGSGIYLDQLLGRKEAKFDVAKFAWLGSVDQSDLVLYMKADAPWKSIEDIFAAKEAPKCGSTGTSDLTSIIMNILNDTLGVKFHEVRGYPGGVEIDLALEKGEIHCRGTGITTHFAREPYFTWHKTGFDRHIVQTGAKKDPRMPDAPTLIELMEKKKTPALTAQRRQSLAGVGDAGPADHGHARHASRRVTLLREAYMKTFKDPRLSKKRRKARMDLEVPHRRRSRAQLRDVMGQPKDVIDRVKKLSESVTSGNS